MSGPDGSSIKRNFRCAAGMPGLSLAYRVPPIGLVSTGGCALFLKDACRKQMRLFCFSESFLSGGKYGKGTAYPGRRHEAGKHSGLRQRLR